MNTRVSKTAPLPLRALSAQPGYRSARQRNRFEAAEDSATNQDSAENRSAAWQPASASEEPRRGQVAQLREALSDSPRMRYLEELQGHFDSSFESRSNAGQTVQRILIVGGENFTEHYQANPTAENMTDILQFISQKMNENVSPEVKAQLAEVDPALVEKQLKKWIEHQVGVQSPDRPNPSQAHIQFGRKQQNRNYANWENLAKGLFGWVRAKATRTSERTQAELIYQNYTLAALTDSLINKVHLKILNLQQEGVDPAIAEAIREELTTGVSRIDATVREGRLGHYRENTEARGAGESGVPVNRFELMSNPENYSIGAKVRFLHDLMEYFGRHQRWNPRTSGQNLLPAETAADALVTTAVDAAGGRTAAISAAEGTREEQKRARGMGLTTSTRDEDAPSTILGRELRLPLWAGQSMTTVRMMKLAQWVGADTQEQTALALDIFAFWRQEYDHRSEFAYHTLHEVMDMAQNFGVAYRMLPDRMEWGLPDLQSALARANERYAEMVLITRQLSRRIAGYDGPLAESIRSEFALIKEADRARRAPNRTLTANLENDTGSAEENAALLREVLKQLNLGMAVQANLDRLITQAMSQPQ